ncbi:Ornithine aminotransferase, mitochondrial [Capsicum annuum]|nr:Ornithine aminotransferase, mitochondrial [Capsicum annuum]
MKMFKGSIRWFGTYKSEHKDDMLNPTMISHSYHVSQLPCLDIAWIVESRLVYNSKTRSIYHPIPIVFSKAKGSSVWDPEGKKYLDFLSAYSAVNQGHCHPKIMKVLAEQAQMLTLSSRAFYNDKFPVFAECITSMFGYDMVLPMNTGAEGVETALKLARKWGYMKKRITKNEARIVSCCGCFHGRTLAAISMSCDNEATRGFWPLLPGQLKVDFGDAVALEKLFKEKGDHIAGFLFEPIQGEAGVIIPPEGYLKAVRDLCSKYNILMIADEIQSGLARSGRLLACDWEEVRPDVVILGKALGGGVLPVSAVLADKDVMLCIQAGEHGRDFELAVPLPQITAATTVYAFTFGGNPLASAVAIASLDVIRDEGLAERSAQMGEQLRHQLIKIQQQCPHFITEVRGKGLFNAVELNSKSLLPVTAYDICMKLKERGVLAKPTHDSIIRLTPPLSMSLEELGEGAKALHDVLVHDLPKMQKEKPARVYHATSTVCDRCGRDLYGSA